MKTLIISLCVAALVGCGGLIQAESDAGSEPDTTYSPTDPRTPDVAAPNSDAGLPDTTSAPDASVPGTSVPDAPDAAAPDASSPDTDAGVPSIDAGDTRVPVGACVTFQAVTCSVYYNSPAERQADCVADLNGRPPGMWRADANCFNRDRAPLTGCSFDDRTEWFFAWEVSNSTVEKAFAVQSCLNQGGTPL